MWWITSALATTWDVPTDFPTLQEAFDSPSVASMDTILIAPGTFEGASLTNGKTLTVRGDGLSDTVLVRSGQSGVVVLGASASSNLTVRELTIDGQSANAGMFVQSDAEVTVLEVAFVNGRDRAEPAPVGGACLLVQDASAEVHDSTFSGCNAVNGAGGAVRARGNGTIGIYDSTISDSASLGAGGGIKVDNAGTVTLGGTTVSNNSAGTHGGGASVDGTLNVTVSTFDSNEANQTGGAIHSPSTTAVLLVDGATLVGNTAGTSGGAIAGTAQATVERTRIESNTADIGGAIAATGGPLVLRNVYACGNLASSDAHVIDSHPGAVDIANLLSIGNGDATGLVHALDGNVRHSTFAYDQGTTLVRVEGGLFADNVIASALTPNPTALNVIGPLPDVYNNLVWGGSVAASFDTLPLLDDPGLVLSGSACSDLFESFATAVVDRGVLLFDDPDGSPGDLGHLGGPEADGAFWGADEDGDGSLRPSDCDDTDAAVRWDAQEVCDGIDNDCDGLLDDADPDLIAPDHYFDGDGDGYASDGASPVPFCNPPSEYVLRQGDCDDTNPLVYDGAIEACPDNLDNDCDMLVDAADPDYSPVAIELYYDDDQDGVGVNTNSVIACSSGQPYGFVPASEGHDCDDTNPLMSPQLVEVCDPFDNNCNGTINEGFLTSPYYPDTDGDGYGAGTVLLWCEAPPGMVPNSTDCDDTNANVNPMASEVCDGIDQNCQGGIDEGLPTTTWYIDADGDGFGDELDPGTEDCLVLTGHTTNATDCDDSTADVNPGEDEVPDDGIDNDCDGEDEVSPVVDTDGDGIPDDIDPDPNSAGDLTGDKPEVDYGCGCQSSGVAAAWLAPLALAVVRRRRQAS